MSDYAKLLETSMREFERGVEQQVERAFEAVRPGDEVPIIGGEWPPPEYRGDLKQRVAQALRARKWFELEAPKWAQPLPLSFEDCLARFNGPNRNSQRGWLVGEYGKLMRGRQWEFQHAPPFEEFCAGMLGRLTGSSFTTP